MLTESVELEDVIIVKNQAQEPPQSPQPTGDLQAPPCQLARAVFRSIYNAPRVDEKEAVRAAWTHTFGCDIWRPYYVLKDIEKRVCEKTSVKFFKMKGKPEFRKGQFFYVFRTAF